MQQNTFKNISVACIHAMEASTIPTISAFNRNWREAALHHIIDPTLSEDVSKTGLDETMHARFLRLTKYALSAEHSISTGTTKLDSRDLSDIGELFHKFNKRERGVLFTCSAFGSCIERVQNQFPEYKIFKPNEAMITEAISRRGKIGILSVFEPTVYSIKNEIQTFVHGADREVEVQFIPSALEFMHKNNEIFDRVVADAAKVFCRTKQIQILLLAMFSMARAAPAVEDAVGKDIVVLTSPDSAVRMLKNSLL